MMAWITRFDDRATPQGLRVAVKDAIDMAGVATTAGCVAVRDRSRPAAADAVCLAGIRASDALIVGKTTLTELCLSPTGINGAFGTPVNPLAPDRIPGGSSSGSAVAVAAGEADVALGTDTAGSVRIPAACCGIVGLKTTWGRVSTVGVWPLSSTLDSVGPLARDVAGVTDGMRLLEPGFMVTPEPARVVGRLRVKGAAPAIEAAVDAALQAAGLTVRDVRLDGWEASLEPLGTIILAELWRAHADLVDTPGVSAFVNNALRRGSEISPQQLTDAMTARGRWQVELARVLEGVELLALPTLVAEPPRLTEVKGFRSTLLTAPINLAGLPALAMPVPSDLGPLSPSLQLVGRSGGEDLLCATGLVVEAALRKKSRR